jgi:hypothetical protein
MYTDSALDRQLVRRLPNFLQDTTSSPRRLAPLQQQLANRRSAQPVMLHQNTVPLLR